MSLAYYLDLAVACADGSCLGRIDIHLDGHDTYSATNLYECILVSTNTLTLLHSVLQRDWSHDAALGRRPLQGWGSSRQGRSMSQSFIRKHHCAEDAKVTSTSPALPPPSPTRIHAATSMFMAYCGVSVVFYGIVFDPKSFFHTRLIRLASRFLRPCTLLSGYHSVTM